MIAKVVQPYLRIKLNAENGYNSVRVKINFVKGANSEKQKIVISIRIKQKLSNKTLTRGKSVEILVCDPVNGTLDIINARLTSKKTMNFEIDSCVQCGEGT